jgi:hypothetical protein
MRRAFQAPTSIGCSLLKSKILLQPPAVNFGWIPCLGTALLGYTRAQAAKKRDYEVDF